MIIKIFGKEIFSASSIKNNHANNMEEYDITNSSGVTMHVNAMNNHKIPAFKAGLNPRCGLSINQCSEGLGHVHA